MSNKDSGLSPASFGLPAFRPQTQAARVKAPARAASSLAFLVAFVSGPTRDPISQAAVARLTVRYPRARKHTMEPRAPDKPDGDAGGTAEAGAPWIRDPGRPKGSFIIGRQAGRPIEGRSSTRSERTLEIARTASGSDRRPASMPVCDVSRVPTLQSFLPTARRCRSAFPLCFPPASLLATRQRMRQRYLAGGVRHYIATALHGLG